MIPSGRVFGLLRRFTGQVVVSLAATVCATAIYGHLASERSLVQAPSAIVSPRAEGGLIESRNVAYYPEHLAALDSLSRFHPLSMQRTAELAEELRSTQVASLSDAARPRRGINDVLPPARPPVLAQVTVLPPRRPAMAAAPSAAPGPVTIAAAPVTIAADPPEAASKHATIWGVELPRFVPTGASVMDKLASVKDRLGGLIHVSSR